MAADSFSGIANSAVTVTPSDSGTIPATLGLYIGGVGDVKVAMSDGSQVVFPAVPAGTILPICVTQVFSTGTGATSIVAMYS